MFTLFITDKGHVIALPELPKQERSDSGVLCYVESLDYVTDVIEDAAERDSRMVTEDIDRSSQRFLSELSDRIGELRSFL